MDSNLNAPNFGQPATEFENFEKIDSVALYTLFTCKIFQKWKSSIFNEGGWEKYEGHSNPPGFGRPSPKFENF